MIIREIGEIYKKYSPELYRYLLSLTHRSADAEDLLSETFLRALAKLSTFRGDSSIRTWLYAIARNVWIESLRKSRDTLNLDEDFDPSILQKVPTRFVTQAWWPEIPTEEDLQNTLREIKAALEEYEMPMTYYDIMLVPEGAADDESLKESIIESGVVASEDINKEQKQ